MHESLTDLVLKLNTYHFGWALLAASVVLIVVDYYFPTDWPAHLAYFCCSAASFLFLPLNLLASAIVGLLIWLGLELLHRLWFRRFLQNAPSLTLEGSSMKSQEQG